VHTLGNRLLVLARRPAPVQATWLGYPGSTGIDAVEYRITDPQIDPPDAPDLLGIERPLQLPDSFVCVDPLPDEPAANALPARDGPVTFASMNNFMKVNEMMLDLWARILIAAPESHLLIHADASSARARTTEFFRARGVVAERIEFLNHQLPNEFRRTFHRIDIHLDTFPFNGLATTIDALWMGVPVVTLAGDTPVSRSAASVLRNINLPELIAHSPDDYVRVVTELAGNPPRLAELRQQLRSRVRASPLMDVSRFARNMEAAYRTMWHAYVNGQLQGERI
jgi:predicted O-linked N-acetylglucosamine transferase (SPINDLY family)